MIINDYGITVNPITSRNPQSKAILERVHQTVGNILRTFKVQNMVLTKMYSSLHHVCLKGYGTHYYSIHSCSVYIWTRFNKLTSWHRLGIIRKRKQDLINEGNKRENCYWINHTYKQVDKVLLKNAWKTKFNQHAYIGPYVITAIRNNGTVSARKGIVTDKFNIQNPTPYKE